MMGYGDPAMMGYGDPAMMAGGYFDPGMMGPDPYYDPINDPYYDPAMDPANNPGMDPNNPGMAMGPGNGMMAPDPLDFSQPGEIRGTNNPNDMTARTNGDILTGLDGGDLMWSTGFNNVVFNYESSDIPSLRAEAFMDEINGGYINNNSFNSMSGINVGLGSNDILQFENLTLNYGTTVLNSGAGNVGITMSTITSPSQNVAFAGDGLGPMGFGIEGDVGLFNYLGNVLFAIDGDATGNVNPGGDILFDVDDSITSAQYDASLDAFTFA